MASYQDIHAVLADALFQERIAVTSADIARDFLLLWSTEAVTPQVIRYAQRFLSRSPDLTRDVAMMVALGNKAQTPAQILAINDTDLKAAVSSAIGILVAAEGKESA